MTKEELVEKMRLKERGDVDYALPQGWVDFMNFETMENVVPHFVWFYPIDNPTLSGYAYPLTDQGVAFLNEVSRA